MSHIPLTFNISGKRLRWMDRGSCNGVPDWDDLFFADERAKRRGLPAEVPPEAERFCGACVVRVECLAWALENDEEYGVWGGTTHQQRKAMRRPIVRAKCSACQGSSLFRIELQQVCGNCGSSWAATKIHGHARAAVELPAHPARTLGDNVIPLPGRRPIYQQMALFDWAATQPATRRKRSCRRRKIGGFEQLQIPGIAMPPSQGIAHVRTNPVAPLRAA